LCRILQHEICALASLGAEGCTLWPHYNNAR
jgi:hypothetical protein